MKNSKKQDYKTLLFIGAWITDGFVECMSTEQGRESLYQLLRLYKERKANGGEINVEGNKYKVVIG